MVSVMVMFPDMALMCALMRDSKSALTSQFTVNLGFTSTR
jgi:hypothetical protein